MTTKQNTKRLRKKEVRRVPFPMVFAGMLGAVAVLGLSYMWLCASCDTLGNKIKKAELELEKARKRDRVVQERWATVTNPANLRAAINRFDLNMSMPSDDQIVQVGVWEDRGMTAMVRSDSLWAVD